MNNLCIIPARGGSKRIPRKNIKDFLGKPMIAYAIEAAINSNIFEEIMVSTEDEEIANIAITYGAKVPVMRSNENSNDNATTMRVLLEVVGYYKGIGKHFDFICCLYPCTPLLKAELILKALEILNINKCNSVFPLAAYNTPIQRALKIVGNSINYENPELANTRTQDLEKRYFDAGQFYFMKTEVVLNNEPVIGNNAMGLIIDEYETQDIDNPTDWKMAEMKYQFLNK